MSASVCYCVWRQAAAGSTSASEHLMEELSAMFIADLSKGHRALAVPLPLQAPHACSSVVVSYLACECYGVSSVSSCLP